MHPLRYFKLWMALGYLFLALISYLSMTTQPAVAIPLQFGDKLGHFMAYFILMAWFTQLYRSRFLLFLHGLLLVTLGVALEYVQGYTGRHFEYADMVANTLGVAFGFLLLFTPLHKALRWFEGRFLVRH